MSNDEGSPGRMNRADAEALYRRLAGRARRRRRARPLGQAILAVAVLAGSIGVGWKLISLFGTDRVPRSAISAHPPSVPGAALPTPPSPGQELRSVDASGPNDVWAVGERTTIEHSVQSLVEHWDGIAWTVVPCPDIGPLTGVTVSGPGDMWAVGPREAIHWTAGRCSSMRLPGRGNRAAISSSAPDDVWVVGVRPGNRYAPNTIGWDSMAAHWNGATWEMVSTPNRSPRDNYLTGVVALSPTDVWAAGYTQGVSGIPLTFVIHWDGTAWHIVDTPNPGNNYNVIWGMGRDGSQGVWAVGHYGDTGGHTTALLMRWTGSAWELTRLPTDPLFSVTGLSGSSGQDVWAVGSLPTSSFALVHFNGARWANVDMEGPPDSSTLLDVMVLSASDAWAVGDRTGQQRNKYAPSALIEHWDGGAWQVVAPPAVPNH